MILLILGIGGREGKDLFAHVQMSGQVRQVMLDHNIFEIHSV